MDSREDDRKSHSASQSPVENTADYDEIACLAYCYYEERGRGDGWHEDDWYRAEQEIRRRRGEQAASPATLPTSDARETSQRSAPRTVIGVFHSLKDAQNAFDELLSEGFTRDEISFIVNKAGASQWTEPSGADQSGREAENASSSVAADAGIGAAVGGVGGLLLGFAGMAVPGIGPVLAAGPIVAALGGAGLGAAAGGLIGALVEGGVPEDEAGNYAEGLRRGGILITVSASGHRADRAAELLDRAGAVDIDDRVSDWRSRGWTRHDDAAPPLTGDELRREREYFTAANRQAQEWSSRTPVPAPAGGSRKKRRDQSAPQLTTAAIGADSQAERKRASRIYGQ